LKNFSPYLLLLFFIPLLFVQCASDHDENKKDYNGKLKYFPNQQGIEYFIKNNENAGAYITLPECFTKDYSSFSISNKNNFVCFDNKVFFSVDAIPKADINHYAEYFNDTKIKSQEDIYIMRDYCIATRAFGLTHEKRSIYSNFISFENKPIHLGSVQGKKVANDQELLYQFGVIEGKDTFYILQAILSSRNTSYLYNDILEIFKSFRLN